MPPPGRLTSAPHPLPASACSGETRSPISLCARTLRIVGRDTPVLQTGPSLGLGRKTAATARLRTTSSVSPRSVVLHQRAPVRGQRRRVKPGASVRWAGSSAGRGGLAGSTPGSGPRHRPSAYPRWLDRVDMQHLLISNGPRAKHHAAPCDGGRPPSHKSGPCPRWLEPAHEPDLASVKGSRGTCPRAAVTLHLWCHRRPCAPDLPVDEKQPRLGEAAAGLKTGTDRGPTWEIDGLPPACPSRAERRARPRDSRPRTAPTVRPVQRSTLLYVNSRRFDPQLRQHRAARRRPAQLGHVGGCQPAGPLGRRLAASPTTVP
jgi:hypothetical protein